MANKKISDFTAVTSVAANDLIEIETAAGNSRKVTKANFGGGGRTVNLGTMRPLTDFTQVKIDGTTGGGNRTAVDTSGKAITLQEAIPDTTLRVVGLRRAMPSTTSRVAVFVQPNVSPFEFHSVSYGFSDATKFHVVCFHNEILEVQTWSNSTSRVSATNIDASSYRSFHATGFWLGLRVDNASGKAYWEISNDGVNFATVYVVTQSSGYLGTGAYTNAFVGMFAYNQQAGGADYPCSVSILDWDESGLSRTFA